MKSFHHQDIAQLAHELTMAPMRHRLRQVMGIQRAIELVAPSKEYPYAFVCFHITGYRPRRKDDLLLSGKELIADLIQLLDGLTAASPLPATFANGRLHDTDALAKRFNVSTKTISRWRKRGLAGCWYVFDDKKPRLAFTTRAVQCFVVEHQDLVRRGATFQLMDAKEKHRIITRARELVASEKLSLHLVTLAIAKETGRAVETIRYTLRNFDQENPDTALFDGIEQPQPIDENTVIYEAYVAGDTTQTIAERFGKRETQIRRIIRRARADELAAKPVVYMYNEAFDAPGAEAEILASQPPANVDGEPDATAARVPASLPAYLRELYRTPLLGKELEGFLFRKMNYLLHRADVCRQVFADDPSSATVQQIAAVDHRLTQATEVKNRIIQANLRLVVSIAKRHLSGNPAANLFELVSDGNIALMRAVEKFDFARGFRFSTYASWAIMRSYARAIPDSYVHAGRFQTGHDDMLAISQDHRSDEHPIEDTGAQLRSALTSSLGVLDKRERSILEAHFGLAGEKSSQTLSNIGKRLGVSKERVRQIEIQALRKLRGSLGEDAIELLAG